MATASKYGKLYAVLAIASYSCDNLLDLEPHITRDVCLSCIHEINYSVDFNTLLKKLNEQGVADNNILFGVLRGIQRKHPSYKHREDQIKHLLRILEGIEGGLQMFYHILKETRRVRPQHSSVVESLEQGN